MVMVFSQQWITDQNSKYDCSQGPRGVRSEGKEEKARERGKLWVEQSLPGEGRSYKDTIEVSAPS